MQIKLTLILSIIFCLSNFYKSNAQSFYFENTKTTLIKTTDQTPAHWYINIYNATEEAQQLRWKVLPSLKPNEWIIGFNDQNNNYENIAVGDSADFTLFPPQAYPQKLIIGNDLNNTTGNGSVFFEVYDPKNPGIKEIIEYEFQVSQAATSIQDKDILIKKIIVEQNQIVFPAGFIGETFSLVSPSGKVFQSHKISHQNIAISDVPMGIVILKISYKNSVLTKKIFR